MDSIKVVTLRALPNCDLIHNQYQHLNALLQRSTECLHNREWSTGTCYGQCVQMLHYKVAQFLPKVSQNVSTTILLKKWCFQNSPKGHQTIWLLLIEKLSLTTLKKSPNLVTLVTVKIKAKWHNIYFEQRLKTRNTLNDFLIFEILFESFKFCSRVVVHLSTFFVANSKKCNFFYFSFSDSVRHFSGLKRSGINQLFHFKSKKYWQILLLISRYLPRL